MLTNKHLRSAFAIDIQNLVGSGNFNNNEALQVRNALEENFQLKSDDQIYVATGPGTIFEARFAFPDGQVQFMRGPNGADYKIKEHLSNPAFFAGRFREVIVGTGDHELVAEVKALKEADISVTIVGIAGTIHKDYWGLGISVVELTPQLKLATLKSPNSKT